LPAPRARPRFVIEGSPGSGRSLTLAWWTRGPAALSGPVLVSITDFELRRARDVPRVYLEGLRLRRAWPSMSGALGMWLWTKPLRRRAGSVSVWRSAEDLHRFVRWPPHVAVMRRYRGAGELSSASWDETGFDAPAIWASAAARIGSDDPERRERRRRA
jgi:hypothetical protein